MALRSVIMWTLFSVIVVFVLSTGVQAQELTDVLASEILKQIENGENISRENVNITGVFNLTKIDLETVPIARSKLQIVLGLEEELTVVKSEIAIINSTFKNDVDSSNTQFRTDIDFGRTTFLGKTDFKGAEFRGGANFCDADFAGYADFWRANFSGIADFRSADFRGDADFGSADFRDADFRYADFRGDAGFGSADFRDADFRYADFRGDADFKGADFTGDADFKGADFIGNATFNSTEFDKVSFTGTTFTNVALIEIDYNQMNVEWSTLKDTLAFNGPAYIKLIKNFREMQHFENADAAYYQYRQLSQKNKKWSEPSKLMDALTGLSCGYGVKPERPLIWGFLLIIVFALVYKQGKGIKRLKESDRDDSRVSFWDAFYFSVTTFTTVGYGDWYPIDRYRIVVMIEGVLGWLLLALFIVTLVNVMIRP